MWIEKRPTIFVSLMSWNIPKFNKEIPLCIAFIAVGRATRTSICEMLDKAMVKLVKSLCYSHYSKLPLRNKQINKDKQKRKKKKKRETINPHLYTNHTPNCLRRPGNWRTFNDQMDKWSFSHTYQQFEVSRCN